MVQLGDFKFVDLISYFSLLSLSCSVVFYLDARLEIKGEGVKFFGTFKSQVLKAELS